MNSSALVLVCLAAGLCIDQDQKHGKIAWERDPVAALDRAKSQRKAALLYFTADW